MLNLRKAARAFGLTVIFLAVVAVFVWIAIHNEPNKRDAEQETNNQNAQVAEILASERVAYYTRFLAGFTGGLLIFGLAQIYYLIRADETARKSAEAAKTAAEALPIVESAYVYPEVVSVVGMSEYIRESAIYFLDQDRMDTPRPDTCDIAFKIKNYGKTPAILKSVSAGLGVWPVTTERILPMPKATLGPMEPTDDFTAKMEIGLTQRQAHNIMAHQASLSCCGTIVFLDIWGNESTTIFDFGWEPDIERMALRHIETTQKRKATLPGGR